MWKRAPRVNALVSDLRTLASIGVDPAGGITRLAWTEPLERAIAWCSDRMADAGLATRRDAAGNLIGCWGPAAGPAVVVGSHLDTVPSGGAYDGALGVLAGIAAVRELRATGWQPARPVWVVAFMDEEGVRFGAPLFGSRSFSGEDLTGLLTRADSAGITLDLAMAACGRVGRRLPDAAAVGQVGDYLELHIEQGPVLEQERVPLGIVTAIAAPASLRVHLEGVGGHAGTVLMPDRRDALCAAAEIILGVEAFAKSSGSINTVATTGFCEVYPNAVNSVPSRVRLEIDIRDVEQSRRDQVIRNVIQGVEQVCTRREIKYSVEIINIDPPAKAGSEVLKALVAACSEAGVRFKLMVSRAYHDSLFMARIAPTAMLFIPCREGISHRPDEYAAPEDIARGTYVLALTLAKLSLAEDKAALKEDPVLLDE